MTEEPGSSLELALAKSLRRRQHNATLRRLTTSHTEAIDFSSNDFLSLSTSLELRQAFLDELKTTTQLGSGGSRLLDGNSQYAEHLEQRIASFHDAESALLCNSGYDANVAIFSCIPQPGDVIIYDEYIHASVHDGMRMSRASQCICFAHNDVSALRSVIDRLCMDDSHICEGRKSVFIALETVYSMDGDLAPIDEVVRLMHELLPANNVYLIIDEAHSTGLFGSKGRGRVHELSLQKSCLIRLHTFGKSLAANGAAILCSPLVRQYLINYARPLIYTTFMSHPGLAAIKVAYDYMESGKTESLARHVRFLSEHLHQRLIELEGGLSLSASQQHLFQVPVDCPQTPIFAVLTSQPKALAKFCQDRHLIVRGIVPPTVPTGTERVRVCLHAGNTVADIEKLIGAIQMWLLQMINQEAEQVRSRL